jgi:hypothetical protein
MVVITNRGEEIELTHDEELYYKALKRLEKYANKQGRIRLFGASGSFSIRINNVCSDDEFDTVFGIFCDGGAGGDNF